MFRWAFIAACILTASCNVSLFSQTRAIDSLRNALMLAKHDTARCSAYIALGMELYPRSADSALVLWRACQRMAVKGREANQKGRDPDLFRTFTGKLADACNKIGFLKKEKKAADSAVWYHRAALAYNTESGNTFGAAKSYYNLANVYWQEFNYPQAAAAYEQAVVQIRAVLSDNRSIPNLKVAASMIRSLGMTYVFLGKYKEAEEALNSAALHFEEAGDKEGLCICYTNYSSLYGKQGNIPKEIEVNQKCVEVSRGIKNIKLEGMALNNLGSLYIKIGNIPKAFEYFDRSLMLKQENYRLKKDAESYKSLGAALLNLGTLHSQQGDFERALKYYSEGIVIGEKLNDVELLINAYLNLGSLNTNEDDPAFNSADGHSRMLRAKRSYHLYSKGIKLAERADDIRAKAFFLVNQGQWYRNFGDTNQQTPVKESPGGIKLALTKMNEALELLYKINDKEGASNCLNNIAGIELKKNDASAALAHAKKSFELSESSKIADNIKEASFLLAIIYKRLGDHRNALQYCELYIKMRDSLNNESTRKASIRSQLKYEYEKQAAADSVAHAKASEVKSAELKRQAAELKAKKNQQYALFGGLFLVLLFSVFMYNRFKVTQKQKSIIELQKEEVEEQKKLVEEKQREVLDSIHYARRIQLAQIPSEARVQRMLKLLKS